MIGLQAIIYQLLQHIVGVGLNYGTVARLFFLRKRLIYIVVFIFCPASNSVSTFSKKLILLQLTKIHLL